MGLVILIVALGGFAYGAFWSASLSFTLMDERNFPQFVSIPISLLLGLLGGIICGAAMGFGLAYKALPHN